ncbi:MAG: hypothetical protein HWN68_13980 [Desulfobacterales bacterium]|nr:hypothetical protein [Desulfobacterales bacterium]
MSELTKCNYCSLQDIRRRAKERGEKVTVLHNSKWWYGKGCNVYVHPKDIDLPNIKEDSKLHDRYSVAWFAELPDHCCC